MRGLTWVAATRNEGKLRELRRLFRPRDIMLDSLLDAGLPEDVEAELEIEAWPSFDENAMAKAKHFSRLLPGRTIIADDSGLAIDDLGGAPGVRSRRWSGRADLHGRALDDANNTYLLQRIAPLSARTARFVCAAACTDGRRELITRGELCGELLLSGRGVGGFGYDPHFVVTSLGQTLAEISEQAKEELGHRGKAFRALLAAWQY